MLSPVEQAHILTLPTHIILLDNFMLPNHGYFKWQLILSNFIDFSTFFCAHTCLFWLPPPTQGCHCPHIRLAHPPPTSWPCAITASLPPSPRATPMATSCACTCPFWASVCPCTHPCTSCPWGLTYPLSC